MCVRVYVNAPCAEEVLVLTGATVGYGGRLEPLISSADLTVRRGDRLLIVGPNGAGKSTLLRTLGGGLRLMAGQLAHGEARDVHVSYHRSTKLVNPLYIVCISRSLSPTTSDRFINHVSLYEARVVV